MLEALRMVIYCTQLFSARCQAAQLRQAPRASAKWMQCKTRRGGSTPSMRPCCTCYTRILTQFRLYRRGAVAANNVAASGREFVSSEWNMAPSSGF